MEVEATEPKTFGETAERVYAVGLQEEALRLIPHPPEASSWGFVGGDKTLSRSRGENGNLDET